MLGFIYLYLWFCYVYNLLKRLIFTCVILSTPACDVYVQLKTRGAAIKIARENTNNQ